MTITNVGGLEQTVEGLFRALKEVRLFTDQVPSEQLCGGLTLWSLEVSVYGALLPPLGVLSQA